MSLGLARKKELQKRRTHRLWSFLKFMLILVIIAGSSYFSFDTGQKIALRGMTYSKENFEQQTAALEKMRRELGNSKADVNKLQKLLPNQKIQDVLTAVNRQAANGIDPVRMASLISGLSNDVKCEEQSRTKRVIILTPISQNNDSSASFYRGLITVTGKGSPTLNEDGNPEAWYDPAKPITMTFTLPGGESQEKAGKLPLYHSVILENTEYRFTINSGRRSFVDIIIRKCSL